MYDIKDKVVLVTGGAAGIGAGVVRAFLEDGAKVSFILLVLHIHNTYNNNNKYIYIFIFNY